MEVLGVLFDSKLQWIQHIATAIKKANNYKFVTTNTFYCHGAIAYIDGSRAAVV